MEKEQVLVPKPTVPWYCGSILVLGPTMFQKLLYFAYSLRCTIQFKMCMIIEYKEKK